ncbi:uncharacterized protein LOC143767565 [Ranitomeya variabilis]|uniref:uncharacterized protein LOC143767565 n=1 Tax=Ranitomeya variabilis TaxID=490064 RepID=UPI0040574780
MILNLIRNLVNDQHCAFTLSSRNGLGSDLSIRLVNGNGQCNGRVEILYNGAWGTVCDDYWDINAAQVVCRQLNCGQALAFNGSAAFGQGQGVIVLDDVQCTGNEQHVWDCLHQPFTVHNCGHNEDAGVVCSGSGSDLSIRLVNGNGQCNGRVEILYNGAWGTVCDDYWDINAAQVVCRQLNCGQALAFNGSAAFGQGQGVIVLDDVQCTGNEQHVWDCLHQPFTVNNCGHNEDAGVVLVNGNGQCNGRVEILYNGAWGTVCDDYWDINAAQVVCRQLNCGQALAFNGSAAFGQGQGVIVLDDVQCTGNEQHVWDCLHQPFTVNNCGHNEDAGVVCSGSGSDLSIRLVNGNGQCNGRVEILYNGAWGTVCDDYWDINAAQVVCRQLNCGQALAFNGSAAFGQGQGVIVLDDVQCTGNEQHVWDCLHQPFTVNNCGHNEDAGVVRLVNGNGQCNGRVEILYNGAWGTVCDDYWDINAAQVVCRQLNCGQALAFNGSAAFGQGQGVIVLDDVQCTGNEQHVWDCLHQPFTVNNCGHNEDAGVVCSDLSIRLVNGNGQCNGRVEILYNGAWGTVCDDYWDINAAQVVCRQLNCGQALAFNGSAAFGQGQGVIVLDDVQCTGNEQHVWDCLHQPFTVNNCGHNEDAGVVCSGSDLSIRLVNGNGQCNGRVEILYNGAWGTVCDDYWDINAAQVVCRQLNCGQALAFNGSAAFGQGQGVIVLDDVQCTGNEQHVWDCLHQPFTVNNCGHNEDAGVVCSGSDLSIRLVNGNGQCNGRVEILYNGAWGTVCDDYWDINAAQVVCRQLNCGQALAFNGSAAFGQGQGVIVLDDVQCTGLVNGNGLCNGRVEILYNGAWGTVCDDYWDINAAQVVCRQLNCGQALAFNGSAAFGQGQGVIVLDDVQCTGNEQHVWDCLHQPFTVNNCGHNEDAGVVCSGSGSDLSIRLVNGNGQCNGRVEILYNGAWGTVCDDYWDINAAQVVCRQLNCGQALAFNGSAAFGQGQGVIVLDDVQCTGNEQHVWDCLHQPFTVNNCGHNEDAGVVCSGSGSDLSIRLVNGNGQCNGRVEILYNGAWGTVCDDYWDINAAQVVCRQLNCGQALAFNGSAAFGQGQGVIVLDDVQCTGNEQHVWDCLHQPFTVNNCGHNEDAGVVCSDLSIRLVNGNGQCNGRVEILYNGAWGTVCDDYWDINAAQVVCRQLNCGQALAFNGSAAFGQGQGVIVLDDVQCTGNEQHVWDCLHQPFTVNNCGHNEDAGVVCSGSDLSIRLVNGNGQCNGRVEILYNGAWGTVCDDYWDINAAQVVCRQLNCGQALAFNGSAAFGQGQGVIVLDDVQCTGNEQHVWDCLHQPFTVNNCGHNEDAGVVCSGSDLSIRLVNGNGQCNGRVEILYNGAWGTVCDDYWDINAAQVVCRQLNCGQALAFNGSAAFGQGQGVIVLDDVQCTGRLVNGNGQCNGRVEILYNGAWGTVCDDYWDINAAQVVCRQLNCGQALAFNGSAAFGQGQGVIVLDDVQCTGNEQHVWDCLHQPFTVNNCGHNEDAGVVCSDLSIRLVNGNGQCNGRVEILYNGAWGTVCDDYWDINAAQVVCRQLNCGQALAFNGSAAFGQGQGVIVLDDVQCTGSGSDLSIRLVNGNGQCNGRVEILYNGAWGTVCDDYWDINAAQVVCRQLNCGQALAFNGSAAFGQGQGVILLDDVQCTGNEQHVWDCLHQPFTVNNCGHNEDAGVVCSDLSIRLVNGNGQCNGRVEILYNGAWGTVCDDYWDINAAQVVCRQLNCGQALAFNGSAAFGQGQGVIVLDDVQCTGNEQHVWDCLHQPFTVNNCGHNEDAGVVCSGSDLSIRLVNGNGQCNGRVEILYNGAWGTVCDDYWDINAAQVVCRQLNCGQALAFNGSAAFGQGQGVIVLDDVQCTGNEQHVWDCLHQPFTVNNCGHNEDAGVVCSGSDLSIRLVNGNGQCNGRVEILYNGAWGTVCDDYWDINAAQVVCRQLNCGQALAFNGSAAFGQGQGVIVLDDVQCTGRLVNGNGQCNGRVEILYNGAWGTVCDDYWDINAAQVVCRQLNCGQALAFNGSAAFGQGQGVIVLDDVQCTGNEQHVWDCLHQPFTVNNCGHNEDAGVVCSDLSIRLVNGNGQCNGRVEILYNGAWGTVCDDYWDINAAQVVCRQLNCGQALAFNGSAAFGQGQGVIVLDDVQCTGSGSDLSIRLVNGNGQCNGRVEILYNGAWGTVCDDYWDINAAQVVCRQLNCGQALALIGSAAFGQGQGVIVLDDVQCTGNEQHVWDCLHQPFTVNNCGHNEDAGVVCSDLSIRLVNGNGQCNGRVEILYNGAWGTVCDDYWDIYAAQVVCRQLNCGQALAFNGSAAFGQGQGVIVLDDVQCTGNEQHVWDCLHQPFTVNNCGHNEDAGVVCSGSDLSIRLVNGNGQCNGRVEILYNGAWGTVCDDYWDINAAQVVCRQLNCGQALAFNGSAAFGQGQGVIVLDDVQCTGNEQHVWDCLHQPFTVNNCGHNEDAGVVCSGSDLSIRLVNGNGQCNGRVEILYNGAWGTVCDDYWDIYAAQVVCRQLNCGQALAFNGSAAFGQGQGVIVLDDVQCTGRLVNGNGQCNGRVEILYNGAWGTVCDDYWDINAAQVVCRQLNCGQALAFNGSAAFGQGQGVIVLDDVQCTGNEQHVWDCLHQPFTVNNCGHNEDAGVVCSDLSIRLVNGNGQCNGRVEILYNGAWGTVCDDYWDIYAAQVVCRQLNCGQALAFNGSAAFGQGQGVIVLDDVQCTGSDLSIRLVNGNGQCNGRVEILYNGAWGTVCDDYWDINAAQVVCRQLNCGQALAFNGSAAFGQGQGVIVLDDVQCTGNEQHVWDCLHQPFTVNNCGHNEDAGVVCSDLSIRLVNGNGQCNGRVEILYNGAWGTVCDDYWDINAAQVVCRQLNCGQALAFNGSAAFGQGQGVIVLDDVQCTGNEQHVWDCLHQPFTVNNCGHNEDAGVVCSGSDLSIRLVNGNGQCNGRVEILYNGAWGTVCDDYWDINAAQVVCRQLNCGQALAFNGSAAFGQGQGVIVLDDVQCTGNEQHVWDCLHQPFTVNNCGHNEDAGVVCSGSDLSIRLVNGNGQCNGRVEILYNGAWGTVCDDYWDINAAQVVCRQLNCGQALAFNGSAAFGQGQGVIVLDDVQCTGRLVNGNGQCNGRVEILYNGAWGTVCDDYWDINAAQVVCRQLNCGQALAFNGSAAFGQGQGVIVLDDVQCTGNEQHVWDCLHQPFTVNNCGHNEDAGVVCSDLSIRLVNGNGQCNGRVEILYNGAWGTVCDDYWDINAAQVVCRQLNCGQALAFNGSAAFGQGQGVIVLDDVQCTGSGSDLSIRLVNGNGQCNGRVEILYNGAWGTVCDDYWDINAAQVVCRQLNCGQALAFNGSAAFGQGQGVIVLDDVQCTGNEQHVWDCLHQPFTVNNCGHNEDAGVVCSDLSIRLVNGNGQCNGRVEILYNGAWGTVCDDYWDINAAQVVCRQLNCGQALAFNGSAAFGQGQGVIVLDDVQCTGNEQHVWDCLHQPFTVNNCGHNEDAGVVCSGSDLSIRLVNGNGQCNGRVEILYNGAWGTVCDDYWDINAAQVVCRQLNCGQALAFNGSAAFGQGQGVIVLDDVQCTGNEQHVWDCLHQPFTVNNCGHNEDAGVVCSGSDLSIRLVNGNGQCNGRVEILYNGAWGTVCDDYWDINAAQVVCRQLNCGQALAFNGSAAFGQGQGVIVLDDVQCTGRLLNGNGQCNGRVEILYNGAWGTVCDDYWDINAAQVVCRQLNCGQALAFNGSAAFGQGQGVIVLDDVQCTGNEQHVWDCLHQPFTVNNCGHNEDAGVVCSDLSIRLVNGNGQCNGRVEILYNGAWGTVCDDYWDINAAQVVCRQLNCGQALAFNGSAAFGQGQGVIVLDDVQCTGNEQHK